MKLNGSINSGQTIAIKPKFTLKNTNGILLLKHNSVAIDYVYWEGTWKLSATGEQSLIRVDPFTLSEKAWAVG